MSFLSIDLEKEKNSFKPNSGVAFPKSDIYKVTLDTVRLRVTDKNARHIDIKLNVNGRNQYIMYAFILDSNKGEVLQFQMDKFKALCVTCGITELAMPETESRMWLDYVQKGDTLQDIDVFTDFDNKEVYVKVARKYSIDNSGTIRENYVLQNFYSAKDTRTANEIANNIKESKQYAKDLLLCNDIYENGLTIDEVQKWRDNGYKKVDDSVSNTSTTSTDKPNNPFNK